MIFDELSKIMNSDTARNLSKRTGLNKDKINRMANSLPFVFDAETVAALDKLGFKIILVSVKLNN